MHDEVMTVRMPRRSRPADPGSAFVRETRLASRERLAALRAARDDHVVRTMRWTSLVAICFTAAIVLNDGASRRWNRLVRHNDTAGATVDEPIASVRRPSPDQTVVAMQSPDAVRYTVPLVTLGAIEAEDSAKITTRAASLSRPEPRQTADGSLENSKSTAPAGEPLHRAAANFPNGAAR